jgi:nucleotide-binding universal stress UspA family protein
MTQVPLKHIVCAVRGGRESRNTVTKAIDLALVHKAKLTFVHVLDAEFLEHATIAPLSVVYQALEEMGEFAMLILCDRARRRGVEDVGYIVRQGDVHTQLRRYVAGSDADRVVMGQPIRSPGRNIFKPAELDAFVAGLEEEDVEILRVMPELE